MTNIRRLFNLVVALSISIMFLSSILIDNLKSLLYFVYAQNSITDMEKNNTKIFIPTTISKQSQEILKNLTRSMSNFVTPEPDDLEDWKKLNQKMNSMAILESKQILDTYKSNVTYTKLADVNVIDVKPQNWKDNGKILVYLHGGGYTLFSANSTLDAVMPISNTTGLRVISVDYTLAPFSKWNQTTTEIVSVIQALIKEKGYSPDDIAIYGDSAGGGLVVGSVLKMRDEGIGIPAAVVLWSPWADLTRSGDSYYRLNNTVPILQSTSVLNNMADAYANHSDQNNPYVSPVYGNFSKGFPPTLIQGGTSEFFLSDFVRLYQAIDQVDIPVKLDIYEGMPHDFQTFLYNTPETYIAISKMNNFLHHYLGY